MPVLLRAAACVLIGAIASAVAAVDGAPRVTNLRPAGGPERPAWTTARPAPLRPIAHAATVAPIMRTLSIHVSPAKIVHTMQGGIGASFHAIDTPIDGHAGSAWGANPHPDDEAAWRALLAHADWLGLDWCRVEIEQRMYEPARGQFEWDSADMRALYRILDWAESRGVDVFLQQMWQNVRWNAYPEFQSEQKLWLKSAPLDMEAFAEGFAAMAEHLVKVRGYQSVKWFSITNEPGWDWSWWLVPPKTPTTITPGLAAVRAALDRRGVTVPLSGPDWTDMPALYPVNIDFDSLIEAYDIHSYYARPAWHDGGGYPMQQGLDRLSDWVGWAHSRGKPLFLSELGSMTFGWGGSDPGPGSYLANLQNAAMIVEALRRGVDAINRWSFTNRGDLDGQWQLLDTWDPARKRMRERFVPHPNAYALFGVVSRFVAARSDVLETTVAGGVLDGLPRVRAVALRSPRGALTLLIVNDGPEAFDATLDIPRERAWFRYEVTEADQDRADVALAPATLPDGESPALVRIGPRSVTTLSTVRREPHEAAGAF
jgi:hypothetical protein